MHGIEAHEYNLTPTGCEITTINEPIRDGKKPNNAHKESKGSEWPIRVKQDDNTLTYRTIAETLAKRTTATPKDLPNLTQSYLDAIKSLDAVSKIAIKQAFIWSSKVPHEEREDFFQELFLIIYKSRVNDERLAYAMARCDWKNWWKSYKLHSQFWHETRLEDSVSNDDGDSIAWSELFVGEAEFESRFIAELDTSDLISQFPSCIKMMLTRALNGQAIRGSERKILDKWVLSRPTCLASYVK